MPSTRRKQIISGLAAGTFGLTLSIVANLDRGPSIPEAAEDVAAAVRAAELTPEDRGDDPQDLAIRLERELDQVPTFVGVGTPAGELEEPGILISSVEIDGETAIVDAQRWYQPGYFSEGTADCLIVTVTAETETYEEGWIDFPSGGACQTGPTP